MHNGICYVSLIPFTLEYTSTEFKFEQHWNRFLLELVGLGVLAVGAWLLAQLTLSRGQVFM
jgi:hypothetical protein